MLVSLISVAENLPFFFSAHFSLFSPAVIIDLASNGTEMCSWTAVGQKIFYRSFYNCCIELTRTLAVLFTMLSIVE